MVIRKSGQYEFKLFVRGHSLSSARTILAVQDELELRVPGRYCLEIIDVHQQPEAVRAMNVIATPTLIRVRPAPNRRTVGSMGNPDAMGRLRLT